MKTTIAPTIIPATTSAGKAVEGGDGDVPIARVKVEDEGDDDSTFDEYEFGACGEAGPDGWVAELTLEVMMGLLDAEVAPEEEGEEEERRNAEEAEGDEGGMVFCCTAVVIWNAIFFI